MYINRGKRREEEEEVVWREGSEELMKNLRLLSRFIPIGREDIEWLEKITEGFDHRNDPHLTHGHMYYKYHM